MLTDHFEKTSPYKNVYSLNFDTFNGHSHTANHLRAYDFWLNSWHKTFKDLNVENYENLKSDDYLSRNVNCLFADNRPVALFLTHVLQINRCGINHDYFEMYSQETLTYILNNFNSVFCISYVCVDNEWRKSRTNLPLIDIIYGLATNQFLDSRCCAFLSCSRKSRSVHKVFEKFGAKSLGTGSAFNAAVDYMCLTKENIQFKDKQLKNAIEYFYKPSRSDENA
ncbi:MAG: hypothetical protein KDD40_06115, partial [Bdellovibrionales bacterium]|nr:hypothetical protein [Bdellovibrionales bacterium]